MIAIFRSLFAPPRHLILILAALWLGLTLSEKRANRYGISKEALNNIVYYSILAYVIGGRLLFVISNLASFRESPLGIFSINIDLFDPAGALITAILIGVAYGQRQKLPFWSALDALTPLFAIVAIGVSLSHLAAGTAFGKPAEVAWGIDLWNATRHPSQVYEFIASLIIFGMTWNRKSDSPAGSSFLFFTALTAGARLFLETFRGDSTLVFGGIRLAQLIAWMVLAVALFASESIRREEKVS